MKKLIIAGALGFSLLLLAAGKPPEPAPPLVLKSVEGKTYRLNDYKGKLVFLTFFKEGCAPCKKEVPKLSALMAQYPKQLMVLGIGFQDTDPAHLSTVAQGYGAQFPVLVDATGMVTKGYQVSATPYGVLVDEKGFVVGKWFGFLPETEGVLNQRIQRLIAEQSTKAVAVAVFTESTEGAKQAQLGTKVQQAIVQGLTAQGFAVAAAGAPSAYSIEGKVSKLGSIMGVSGSITQTKSKLKMDEFTGSVTNENFEPLLTDIVGKLKKLPW